MADVVKHLKKADKPAMACPGQTDSGVLAGDQLCKKVAPVPAGKKLGSAK